MQIWKTVQVSVERKTAVVKALFDSGSSFTLMGYEKLTKLFNEVEVKPLPRVKEAGLLNGQKVTLDGYVVGEILIDDYPIVEIIFLSKDIVSEIVIEGEAKSLPDLIIGAPTLETWGLELDLKKGGIVYRGSFILQGTERGQIMSPLFSQDAGHSGLYLQ